jgi:hypothetical protein
VRLRSLPYPTAFLALALAGCPGQLDDPARFLDGGGQIACDPSIDVEADILAASCAGVVCHSPPNPAEGLDLVSTGAAERMRGTESGGCAPRLLFDPASPDQSYLLEKLDDSPGCGERMPPAPSPALSPAQKACVLEWLEAAAGGGA